LGQGLGHHGGAGLDPGCGIGQQEIGYGVVPVDPQDMVGEGRQQASAVLAGGAVDQDCRVGVQQGLEIPAEQDWVPGFERGLGVIVQEEGVDAVGRQIGVPQEGHMRRLGPVTQVAFDDLARKAFGAPGGL